MLIILLIIFITMIGLGIYFGNRSDWDDGLPISLVVVGAISTCIVFIVTLAAINKVVSRQAMEQKIIICEEENESIEQEVKAIITTYIEYEENIYSGIKIEDYSGEKLLLLTQLYPELKTNTLIQSQLDLHKENSDEIKALRKELVNSQVWCWWLYFGKVGGVNND